MEVLRVLGDVQLALGQERVAVLLPLRLLRQRLLLPQVVQLRRWPVPLPLWHLHLQHALFWLSKGCVMREGHAAPALRLLVICHARRVALNTPPPSPLGTYQDQTSHLDLSCKNCPPGQYQDWYTQSSCKNCPSNSYQNQWGQTG